MPASTFGLALFSAQAIGLALLIAALLAPSYHHESIVFGGGTGGIFELSLFDVRVYSTCTPAFPTRSGARNGYNPSAYCKMVVARLDRRGINEVTNILCG